MLKETRIQEARENSQCCDPFPAWVWSGESFCNTYGPHHVSGRHTRDNECSRVATNNRMRELDVSKTRQRYAGWKRCSTSKSAICGSSRVTTGSATSWGD